VDVRQFAGLVEEFVSVAGLDTDMLVQVMTAAVTIIGRQSQYTATRVVRAARAQAVAKCEARHKLHAEPQPPCSLPDVCGTGRCPFTPHPLLAEIDVFDSPGGGKPGSPSYFYSRPPAHVSAGETASIAPAARALALLAQDRLGKVRPFPLKPRRGSYMPEPDLDALYATRPGSYPRPDYPDGYRDDLLVVARGPEDMLR